MIHYRSEIIINRPPAEVFRWLAEPVRQGHWMGMSTASDEGPAILGPNSEYVTHVPKGPMAGAYRLRVAAFEQDRRMVLETIEGKMGWRGTFTFETTPDGGTRMANEGDFTAKGVWRLLEPTFRGEVARSEQRELEKLKTLVEAA